MSANLYRVIHPVRDIDIAARFFSTVLETEGERVSPGRYYFDCGGTILACYDPATDGDDPGDGWRHHQSQYLNFAVADLDAACKSIADAGGEITAEIASMPWGERIFYAKDPFGNPISFVDQSSVFTGLSAIA